MESFQIYINSKNASSVVNNNYNFSLPNIEVPDNCFIYLSVQYICIPYSFYNINSNNNLLVYIINNIQYSLYISVGNYNINQLIDYINSNTNLVLSYNSYTNKITFTNTNYDFSLIKSSTCLELLGFKNNLVNYTSSTKSLISSYCINLLPIQMINVLSNYITYNFNQNKSSDMSILCSVPVNSSPNSLIIYKNINNFKTNLFVNNLSNISIKLTDQDNNIIDLNGLYFNFTLQFDVIPFN